MQKMPQKSLPRTLCIFLLFAVAFSSRTFCAAGQSRARGAVVVRWQPAKLVGGSAVLFRVKTPAGVHSLAGKWLGHEIKFTAEPGKHSFYALAGIPVETATGNYDLELFDTERGPNRNFRYVKKVKISRANYPKVSVTVAKQFTEPSPEQLKQVAADKELKQTVFGKATETQLWDGDFKAPVTAPISGVFGTERVFNGEVQSRHLGLDFAAPSGTPVHAINRGTIVLAQKLYFEGGFIVVDHGEGLMSLYLHLSDFKVKAGDEVTTGEVIALSGGSGRATGPHLHLAVRWQGTYLNPAVLLSLQMPR
jgi:murein DD-endopeptidase MepM/ murein hydrolase activator NlpD